MGLYKALELCQQICRGSRIRGLPLQRLHDLFLFFEQLGELAYLLFLAFNFSLERLIYLFKVYYLL